MYLALVSIIIFVFGVCIGSFLNVLIYRLPNELSILGRSLCPNCKKKISWYDNVPLFSYLFLKGKCRHCHKPISVQYPLVELLTGILFVLAGFILLSPTLNPSNILELAFALSLFSVFLAIFFIDLKHQIIPDQIIYPAIIFTFAYHFVSQQYSNITISNYILSAFGFSFFFLFLHLVTKGRGMGLGDVKLAFLIGLVLGFEKSLLAFYLAFLTGAACGIILILTGRKKFGQHIPFGPFLVCTAMFAYLTGDQVIQWISATLF